MIGILSLVVLNVSFKMSKCRWRGCTSYFAFFIIDWVLHALPPFFPCHNPGKVIGAPQMHSTLVLSILPVSTQLSGCHICSDLSVL